MNLYEALRQHVSNHQDFLSLNIEKIQQIIKKMCDKKKAEKKIS